MDSEEKLCFETKSLGKLKILAFIGNNALLEKMYDTPEKYIIASGFDINDKRWNFGSYFTTLKDAFSEFSERTKIQINAMEKVSVVKETQKTMTTNDLLKKIYNELKDEISKNENEIFIKEYFIPTINFNPNDKSISDHYFASGIEMELERMVEQFDNKIVYGTFKDKYYFSNDEDTMLKARNKDIRQESEKNVEDFAYSVDDSELEEEM